MNWTNLKKRIRRFLRDPDGNIWDDTILKRLFNDEQSHFANQTGLLEAVEVIRVPPRYQQSYFYDWEWSYVDHAGKEYKCLRYQQQSDMVFCFLWESQQVGIGSGVNSGHGEHYTHPFEAWYCTNLGMPVSNWFPQDFRKAKFVAWDREPLPGNSMKNVQSNDPSWQIRKGIPICYIRPDELSNEFYLYPHVSSPVWDDLVSEGEAGEGQVIFDDSNTESGELGTVMDITGQVMNQDIGIAIDSLTAADNFLLVYEAEATDIETESDSGSLPGFLQKYCEYATLERAFSMNNDGKIESLRDYWGWRKNIGMEAVRAYKSKRRTDRDYQLVTKGISGRRSNRHPRLPDTYTAMP